MFSLLSLILSLTFASCFLPLTATLYVTSGSPCEQACQSSSAGTLSSDVVCTDNDYAQSPNATHLKNCVECELGSGRVDSSGNTDFEWAIYNLRFAFSTCVYGFPEAKGSVSTPCQVSCAPLQAALETGLGNQNATQDTSFCGSPAFSQAAINKCASCYVIAGGQNTMSNFLQVINQACVYKPAAGQLLSLNPTTVFTSTVIPPPSISPTPTPHHHHVANLPLVIALPILFFILIVSLCSLGCFVLVRRRHKKVKAEGAIRRVQLMESVGNTPLSPYHSAGGWTPSGSAWAHSAGGWNPSLSPIRSPGGPAGFSPVSPLRGPIDYPAGQGFNQGFQGGYQGPQSYPQGEPYYPPPPSKPVGAPGEKRMIPSLVLPWAAGKNSTPPESTNTPPPASSAAAGAAEKPSAQVFVYDPTTQKYVKDSAHSPGIGVAHGDPTLDPPRQSRHMSRTPDSLGVDAKQEDSNTPSIDLGERDRKDIPLEYIDPDKKEKQ